MHQQTKIILPKSFPLDTTTNIPAQVREAWKDDNKWDDTQRQQDFKREYLGIPFED